MRFSDVNTEFLDKGGTQALIDELKAYIDGISTGNVDLSNYVTKSELQSKLDALDINIDLSNYATDEELTTAISNIDLSAYALKTEIPTVTNGQDGITPHIDSTTKHWMIGDNDTGVVAEGQDGYTPVKGTDYFDGTNGTSPTVTVTKQGKVATITCTDVNGTTTATISDGADGTSSGGSGGGGEITYVLDTEIATGDVWVDGNPIYTKVIDFTSVTPTESNGFNFYMTRWNDWIISDVVDAKIVVKNGTSFVTSGQITAEVSGSTVAQLITNINSYIVDKGLWCNIIAASTYTTIQVFVGKSFTSVSKVYLTMKYTKSAA